MESARREPLWTVETYLRLPQDGQRHELEAGILVAEPQPFPHHAQIQAQLASILREFVVERGLGVVLTETGYVLSRDPDTLRGPDVSFVRRERFDAEEARRSYLRGGPDLAVEILSPSNRPGEIRAKVAEYLAAGTRLVWVVDPAHETVTTYRTLLAPRRVERDGVIDGEDVLPGLSIPVAELLAP
jgi:Uma2 family endonuclease